MPLRFDVKEYLGTNSDGSRSDEFCYYCLKDGKYIVDISMWEMIDIWIKYTDKYNEYADTDYSPKELREILDRVALNTQMGVCMDTCHISDAGYDIAGDIDGVLTEFDRVIGLERLKAVHINDSMNPLGTHKDRHARIGEGYLGEAAFGRIINHPALRDLPFILETPNDLAGYAREIGRLKELRVE